MKMTEGKQDPSGFKRNLGHFLRISHLDSDLFHNPTTQETIQTCYKIKVKVCLMYFLYFNKTKNNFKTIITWGHINSLVYQHG